jgi:hypothetical protein
MNRVLLSLCLFGTALATGNVLFMHRPACPVEQAWAAAAHEPAPAAKPEIVSAAAEVRPANVAFATQSSQATGAASPALPKDMDVTGSVTRTAAAGQDLPAQAGSSTAGAPELVPLPDRKPRVTSYHRPRRYGWRRYYRDPRPHLGFAIRVYPSW